MWQRGNLKYLLILAVISLVLVRIGSEVTGRGAAYWHLDFRTLFRELTSFYHGTYPHAAVTTPAPGMQPLRSDYPPSSFWLFVPWLPPGMSFRFTEAWFLACQIIAAAVLVRFAWNQGSINGHAPGVMLAAAVLAITGLRADLLFGNVALVTTMLLLGLQSAIERERWWTAGGFWLGAMLKPQMGWAFALLFAQRKKWAPIAAASAVLVVLAFAACRWTNVSIDRVIASAVTGNWAAISRVSERYSLVSLLVTAGMSPASAMLLGAIAGVAAVLWGLAARLAGAGSLHRFAYVALIDRICAYHNVCDDLLLAFPLIWLGRRAWAKANPWSWTAFCALGLSIWAPTISLHSEVAKLSVILLWLTIAAWLAFDADKSPRDEASAPVSI